MDSPTSAVAKGSPGGSRIGRPPQWTVSRSRKLARLYVYTTLSIEKILKVLEDDVFRPRKNSAQKTVHKMLDNDPRYLRPESRAEMDQRINSLADSPLRRRKRRTKQARRRVSDCSTEYARQISALLRDFTISSTSDLEDDTTSTSRRPSAAASEHPEHTRDPEDTAFEAFPEPGYALPGDFLTAHTRNCADFPGQDHGSGTCWCSIAKETSAVPDSWLLPTGELSPRARLVLEDPSDTNTSLVDPFGNTALHLFASREGYRDELFAMVLTSPTARKMTNTGDQTFLHVLHVEWFTDLALPSAPLTQLLAFIRDTTPSLFRAADVYGRTFLHRAHALLRDPSPLTPLLPPLQPQRDAFGFTPLEGETPFLPPRRPGSSPPRTTPPPPATDEGAFLAYHARLVQVIQSAYNNPLVEDSAGRNGLHCLAEAILHQQAMDEHRSAVTTRAPKRKLDLLVPSASSPTAGPSSSASSAIAGLPAGTNTPETPLQPRLRHLHGILTSTTLPQALQVTNHYSHLGSPPLHTFISHLPDSTDDKSKTLLTILATLLRYGARIEGRNRAGETPLLVAARLGRKVAMGMLLEQGANVYVRDVHGRGVLEVVDLACRGATGDVALYARLEACRGLLTGRRDWGVVRDPGVVREWTSRDEEEDEEE
ncbi:hypothetical protein B0T16DRAFT_333083 [Cercophora newfieldiana]|uniref:Ankyrin n=1 Tax=Cercophora newfieldiana TaxID=92897 RepID=A0AA40CLR8_9PEZI|nr:hypothetical protein B0T16DRAFT_333083 [Cercophora newfieldiana]